MENATLYSRSALNNQILRERCLNEPRNKMRFNRFDQQLFQQLCKKNVQSTSRTSILSMERNLKVETEPANLKKDQFITKYKTPERLVELSQPRIRSQTMAIPKKESLSLSNMMIYETSPRLLELAKPRRVEKPLIKESYNIPRKVLNAEASKRIIELSQPRRNYSLVEPKRKKKSKISRIAHPSIMSRSIRSSIESINNEKKKMKARIPCLMKKNKKAFGLQKVKSFDSDSSIVNVKTKNIVSKNLKIFKKIDKTNKKMKTTLVKRPVFK